MPDPFIDPNLINDAYESGMKNAAVNRDNASITNARNAQSDFNFGAQARDIRERNTVEDIKVADSGIDVNNANIRNRDQLTESQKISNALDQYENDQKKIKERGLAELNNQGAIAKARYDNINSDLALEVMQSPTTQEAQKVALGYQVQTASQNNINAHNAAIHKGAQDLLEGKIQEATTTEQFEQVQQNIKLATDRRKSVQALTNFRQVDLQNGNPNATIDGIDAILSTNQPLFMSNVEAFQGALEQVKSQYGAGEDTIAKANNVLASVNWLGARQQMGNMVGQLFQGGAAGTLGDGDKVVKSTFELIGLGPSDVEHMSFSQQDSKGNPTPTITVTNTLTNQKKQLDPALVANSAILPSLIYQATKRDNNSTNTITAAKAVRDGMANVYKKPLLPMFQDSFNTTIQNALGSGERLDDVTVSKLGDVRYDMQQDVIKFNPLFQPKYADLANEWIGGLEVPEAALNLVGSRSIKQELEKNPGLARSLREAIENKATGGMPRDIFNYHVDREVKTRMAADPQRYLVTGDATQRKYALENRRRLQQQVVSDMPIPKITKFPKQVLKALGIEDNQSIGTSGILASIGNFLTGTDVMDNTVLSSVDESQLAPVTTYNGN